jgi:hypothetical protein
MSAAVFWLGAFALAMMSASLGSGPVSAVLGIPFSILVIGGLPLMWACEHIPGWQQMLWAVFPEGGPAAVFAVAQVTGAASLAFVSAAVFRATMFRQR